MWTLPWDCDDDSYGSPKSSEGSALGGERGGGSCPHVCDETQRGLLTFLETSQQQQQVTLLVHQSFPEALSAQVTLIQPLHLQTNHWIIIALHQHHWPPLHFSATFTVKLTVIKVIWICLSTFTTLYSYSKLSKLLKLFNVRFFKLRFWQVIAGKLQV